jgi:hypothetical protein
MKKENISTQTLLEILLQEMEHVKEYTKLLRTVGPVLNEHLNTIRKEELRINTKNLEELYQNFKQSAKQYNVIPTWFMVISGFAFVAAIIEGLILYYLVFPYFK